MPNKIDKILNKFISEVSELIGNRLKKVILYGSYARGDYSKNSDIDLMILTDFNDDDRAKIRDLACDLELENDIIISPIVRNIEKYNNRINIIPFYMNVKKEGVVIHG